MSAPIAHEGESIADPRLVGRRLIIHGDDLGISDSVNLGIAEAHRHGVLTSASMMAVGAAFEDAVKICKSLPSLDIGVHLTLIEEQPLLPPGDAASLIDSSNRFFSSALVFTRRYFAGYIDLSEVYRELAAQIRRVREAGLPISHLDSHQHVHMLPGIFEITTRLAREYSIPAVRIPRERLNVALLKRTPSVVRILQQQVLNAFCSLASAKMGTLVRTDHFGGFLFGGAMNRVNLRAVLHSIPASGSVEIMCHPRDSSPSREYSHWGYDGVGELEALLDPGLPSLLDKLGFSLTGYQGLDPVRSGARLGS